MVDHEYSSPGEPLSRKAIEWHRSEEQIRNMTEEDRIQLLLEQSEQLSRLYNALMTMAGQSHLLVTKRDVDLILNPDRQEYYEDIDRLNDFASGG